MIGLSLQSFLRAKCTPAHCAPHIQALRAKSLCTSYRRRMRSSITVAARESSGCRAGVAPPLTVAGGVGATAPGARSWTGPLPPYGSVEPGSFAGGISAFQGALPRCQGDTAWIVWNTRASSCRQLDSSFKQNVRGLRVEILRSPVELQMTLGWDTAGAEKQGDWILKARYEAGPHLWQAVSLSCVHPSR